MITLPELLDNLSDLLDIPYVRPVVLTILLFALLRTLFVNVRRFYLRFTTNTQRDSHQHYLTQFFDKLRAISLLERLTDRLSKLSTKLDSRLLPPGLITPGEKRRFRGYFNLHTILRVSIISSIYLSVVYFLVLNHDWKDYMFSFLPVSIGIVIISLCHKKWVFWSSLVLVGLVFLFLPLWERLLPEEIPAQLLFTMLTPFVIPYFLYLFLYIPYPNRLFRGLLVLLVISILTLLGFQELMIPGGLEEFLDLGDELSGLVRDRATIFMFLRYGIFNTLIPLSNIATDLLSTTATLYLLYRIIEKMTYKVLTVVGVVDVLAACFLFAVCWALTAVSITTYQAITFDNEFALDQHLWAILLTNSYAGLDAILSPALDLNVLYIVSCASTLLPTVLHLSITAFLIVVKVGNQLFAFFGSWGYGLVTQEQEVGKSATVDIIALAVVVTFFLMVMLF